MLDSQPQVILSGAKDPAAPNLAARAASGLIRLYQLTVSPALVALNPTCGCRFAPTCSHYARGALREHGLLTGLGLTFRRLVKCGPWHPGGLDPVPARVCHRVSSPPSTSTSCLAKARGAPAGHPTLS